MKYAKGLGLFVALALLSTACGTKAATSNNVSPSEPTVTSHNNDNAGGKEADRKDQAKTDKAGSSGQSAKTSATGKAESSSTSSGGGATAGNGGNSGASASGSTIGSGASSGERGSGASTPASTAPKSASQVELNVTQNFGQQHVFDQNVSFSTGQYLLDVMRGSLDVETAYGGGFVNSINGTKSGYTDKSIFTRKKRDWFYYVNGSVAGVGADVYPLHSGDEVWWDYHDWSGNGSNAPCVVGEYPHPFVSGYNGVHSNTTVYYSGSHGAEASRIAQSLNGTGAHALTAAYADSAVASPSGNVVVVGTWSELSNQPAIQTLFGSPTHTGLYASFQNGQAEALNYNGKAAGSSGQAVILATGSGNGSTNPVWLVVGASDAGLSQAVNTLVNNPSALKDKVGALINGSSVVGVPVAQ